ncbi:MAG TPA: hypothetical protein VK978_01995 [Candidatus Saccharimonadales bacterium]|nr:hypothetical protein [Candidatus Saccharimonadales bacterium]
MTRYRETFGAFIRRPNVAIALAVCSAVAVVGVTMALFGRAATSVVMAESEAGLLAGGAVLVTDAAASGGRAVQFKQVATPTPPPPTPPPAAGRVVTVSTAAQLTAALANAAPGDVITMANGTYSGKFNSTRSGTADKPITLKGSRSAIVSGGSLGSGYTLSLGTKNSAQAVSFWRFEGFTVTGGQKGIMWDNVQRSVINNLYVHTTGQEAIHLRNFSSNNTVSNNTVTKAGQAEQRYGEGIYVGTAVSNWSTFSQGRADRSNNNQIIGNSISNTGSENIDIKEGTHGGLIADNKLDGTGMCYDTAADCNFSDSMIDVKGEGWTIRGNTAAHMRAAWKGSGVENDGFQVHVISGASAENSGQNNTFTQNTIDDVAGYAIKVTGKATGTVVKCDNIATRTGKGLTNLTCTR